MLERLWTDQGVGGSPGGYDRFLGSWHVSMLGADDLSNTVFPDVFRTYVRKLFECADNDKIYYYVKGFEDRDLADLRRVAFAVDDMGFVRKSGIFFYEADDCFESVATVNKADYSGLLFYTVETGRILNSSADLMLVRETFARYHYGIVRDVFHEHIHHDGSDFSLLPVKADDEREAMGLLCRQFMKGLIVAHKEIRHEIRVLDSKRIVTYAEYADLCDRVGQALGQMAYCSQLHALFPADFKQARHEADGQAADADADLFSNGQASLEILRSHVESVTGNKRITLVENTTIFLTMIAGVLAMYTVSKEVFPNALGPLVAWADGVRAVICASCHLKPDVVDLGAATLALVIFGVLPPWLYINFQSRKQRRNREALSKRAASLAIRIRLLAKAKYNRLRNSRTIHPSEHAP